MSRNLIEQFASSYPKARPAGGKEFDNFIGNNTASKIPPSSPSSPSFSASRSRTRLSDVMEPYQSEYQKPKMVKSLSSDKSGNSTRKFFTVLLIVFLAAFLYSGFAYTISDTIFSKFGMLLFNDEGAPTLMIVVIHSLIFLGLVYLILNNINYC
jgi:hypothetical protein